MDDDVGRIEVMLYIFGNRGVGLLPSHTDGQVLTQIDNMSVFGDCDDDTANCYVVNELE